jgi:AraC-like DNA-binding protein
MSDPNIVLWITDPNMTRRPARAQVHDARHHIRNVEADDVKPVDLAFAKAVIFECDTATADSRARLLAIRRMCPARPIIAAMRDLDVDVLLWAFRAGISDVVQSPLSPREFARALDHACSSAGKNRGARASVRASGGAPKATGEPDSGLSRIIVFVEKNFSEAIRESAMASRCGRSASQFCRDFKAAVGMTFVAYLTDIRMKKARELLANSNIPVADIALACGFTDPSYFSRAFRRCAGEPPSGYRARAEERARTPSPGRSRTSRHHRFRGSDAPVEPSRRPDSAAEEKHQPAP